jgi:hypothetical protein
MAWTWGQTLEGRKCKITISIYNVNFKKVLLGAETWTCTKRERSKLQTVEMKFLRAIVGKTRREN